LGQNIQLQNYSNHDFLDTCPSGSSRQFAGFDCEPEDVVVNSIFERAAKFLPALNKSSLRELLKGGHIRIGLRPYSKYLILFH
jgi:hypothetical protein